MGKHPLYNDSGLQKNNKSHVMYALASKQMELEQLKNEYDQKVAKLTTEISAIETTICIFDKDCGSTIEKISKTVSNIKRKNNYPSQRNSYFERGECKKLILKVLRESDDQLSTEEISLKIQDIKQLTKDNIVTNKKIQKTIVAMLRNLQKENIIIDTGKVGLTVMWKIKPLEA